MKNVTYEAEQKAKAIEVLKTLDIYTPYIKQFEKNGEICLFEGFGGFYISQEKFNLQHKITEFEKEHNALVFAITHEGTEFGEIYDFLYIPKDKEEWDTLVDPCGNNKFYVFAYCWNVSDDFCSEFGDIMIQSFGGGIKRIG